MVEPLVRTSALLIRGDLYPRRTLLCPHDPDRLGRSLMWVPLMVFFPPQTALVLGLGFGPNIDVDNEFLGPIPLQLLLLLLFLLLLLLLLLLFLSFSFFLRLWAFTVLLNFMNWAFFC